MSATEYKLDFAQLKQRITIHQAAQMLQLELKQEGGTYRGKCTACNSSSARALAMTPAKQAFYCWDAKTGGDCIKLVAHIKSVSQYEAAKLLDQHYGGGTVPTVPATAGQTDPRQRPQPPERKPQPYDPERYFQRLVQEHEALAPLGISPATLTMFKGGFAATGRHLGRLALAVADRTGAIVGHFSVALKDEAPRIKYPNDSFTPDAFLFNWQNVPEGEEFVYLTLDPMAALTAIEGGVDNVVAPLGTLNSETLQTLSNWMIERKIGAVEPM